MSTFVTAGNVMVRVCFVKKGAPNVVWTVNEYYDGVGGRRPFCIMLAKDLVEALKTTRVDIQDAWYELQASTGAL